MSTDDGALLEEGRRVLAIEAAALSAVGNRLDDRFVRACRMVAAASGRVLVSGVGKSGHVARKIAATLTSTGTPAVHLHPVEALHGDLGLVGPHDVALFVSKSGDASELADLVHHLTRRGVPIIAVLGSSSGEL